MLLYTALLVLGAVALGFIITASGVVLGAYCVYRTKRDPSEPFMGVKPAEGGAYVPVDALGEQSTFDLMGLTEAEQRAHEAAARRAAEAAFGGLHG